MRWKIRWMNDYSKCFSPQLRAQESQSCVQLVLSPPCQVWAVRLAVSPAPLGFTAEEQDSGLRLDPAARVSPYTVLDRFFALLQPCVHPFTQYCVSCHFDRLLVPSWSDCGYSSAMSFGTLLLRGQCSSWALPIRDLSGQRETGSLFCLWGR